MTLTQLQQDAREEFDKKAKKAGIGGLARITIYPIIDSITARVYAAALDAVESGMPKEVQCPLCEHPIDCADHYKENGFMFCPHKHHSCKDGTAPCMDMVCSEFGLGELKANKVIRSHIRTLREGITSNEHAK